MPTIYTKDCYRGCQECPKGHEPVETAETGCGNRGTAPVPNRCGEEGRCAKCACAEGFTHVKAGEIDLDCGENEELYQEGDCQKCVAPGAYDCDFEQGCIPNTSGGGEFSSYEDCRDACKKCPVTSADFRASCVDDDGDVYLNDSLVYSGRGNSGCREIEVSLSGAQAGDVVTFVVWDGWGVAWKGDGTVNAYYEGGYSSFVESMGSKSGASSESCSPPCKRTGEDANTKCCWPEGEYFQSPQLDDFYTIGTVTIPESDYYCDNLAP